MVVPPTRWRDYAGRRHKPSVRALAKSSDKVRAQRWSKLATPVSRCLFHLRTTKCALVCCSVLESKIVYGNVKGVRVFLRFHSKTLSFFLASFYWLHRDPPSKCIQDEQGGSHHEFGDSEIRVICSIFRHFLP